MCSSSTTIFTDIEINLIRVAGKDHVASLVTDSIIGVCGDIIQEFLYCFVGGFSVRCLLMSEFSEYNYEIFVHGLVVV